jgi:hypothetical protein
MNNYKELIEGGITQTITEPIDVTGVCIGVETAMSGNEYIIEAMGVNANKIFVTVVSGSKETVLENEKINHLEVTFSSGSILDFIWEN